MHSQAASWAARRPSRFRTDPVDLVEVVRRGVGPVIVMGHGFGGVRALLLYAYAEHFAAAGYVVVVFDYRGFGESAGSPRQVLNVGMQLRDWRATLAFTRALPGVDPGCGESRWRTGAR